MPIAKYCENCGKEINRKIHKGCTIGFCDHKCYHEYRRKQMPVRKCEVCGKEFYPVSLEGQHFFCSKKCYLKYRRSNVKVLKCPICGKEFTPAHYHPGQIHFCSQNCYNEWQREESRKKNTINCTNCGKPFFCKNKDKGINHFCSRKCQSEWMTKTNKEKHYKNCVICGNLIEPIYMPNSAHWYTPDTCSQKCRLALSERTCMEKYGVPNASQDEEIKQQKKETMKKNGTSTLYNFKSRLYPTADGTLVRSKDEIYIYDKLKAAGLDVKYERYDERYPYPCDFYLPEFDMFIEYQGFVSHGKYGNEILGPFNSENSRHIEVLNEWKELSDDPFYESIIYVWTVSDPEKRRVAAENGLNWIEFWTVEEFDEWYKKEIESEKEKDRVSLFS